MGGLPKHLLLSKGSGVFTALAVAATARAPWLRSGASGESSLEPLVGRQLRAQRINKCSQSGVTANTCWGSEWKILKWFLDFL